MIELPHWLMVGAAARNVGKTEFACELIQQQKPVGPVFGVKITTIKETDGKCPRGGEGCGVCSSLGDEKWLITEETNCEGRKDTTRMLHAGATKVLWLRAHQAHLEQGIAALNDQLPAGAPVVCESNSARTVVSPGLFLLIRERGSAQMKASSRAVAGLAHRVIAFWENSWDFQPSQIGFQTGSTSKWRMKHNATAIVLAGGKSSRMGSDKSLLNVDGKSIIENIVRQLGALFSEVLVSTNSPEKYSFLELPFVSDEAPDAGPLMGIFSSVKAARFDVAFVTGCDIPTMNISFIDEMMSHAIESHSPIDGVVPVDAEGRYEPLFAVYKKSALPAMGVALDNNRRKVIAFLKDVNIKEVTFPKGDWYRNLNTPVDYRAFLEEVNV